MNSPSRSDEWERVRELEDLLALLAKVDGRRRVIRVQAWRQGSWEAVYCEASQMDGDLARVRTALSSLWDRWIGEARGGKRDDGRQQEG